MADFLDCFDTFEALETSEGRYSLPISGCMLNEETFLVQLDAKLSLRIGMDILGLALGLAVDENFNDNRRSRGI